MKQQAGAILIKGLKVRSAEGPSSCGKMRSLSIKCIYTGHPTAGRMLFERPPHSSGPSHGRCTCFQLIPLRNKLFSTRTPMEVPSHSLPTGTILPAYSVMHTVRRCARSTTPGNELISNSIVSARGSRKTWLCLSGVEVFFPIIRAFSFTALYFSDRQTLVRPPTQDFIVWQ
jgi:hypothetical protein